MLQGNRKPKVKDGEVKTKKAPTKGGVRKKTNKKKEKTCLYSKAGIIRAAEKEGVYIRSADCYGVINEVHESIAFQVVTKARSLAHARGDKRAGYSDVIQAINSMSNRR